MCGYVDNNSDKISLTWPNLIKVESPDGATPTIGTNRVNRIQADGPISSKVSPARWNIIWYSVVFRFLL